MSFFTAVIAHESRGWRARDVDVEDCADLDDLTDMLHGVAVDDRPVVCVIEREDGWFALVRVDGSAGDARLFVSDFNAASQGHYGPVLAPAADVDAEVPLGAHAYERDDEDSAPDVRSDEELAHDAEAEEEMQQALDGATLVEPDPEEPVDDWAGDPGLLSDLGLGATALLALVEDNPDDPAAALSGVGETCGFEDLIEALR